MKKKVEFPCLEKLKKLRADAPNPPELVERAIQIVDEMLAEYTEITTKGKGGGAAVTKWESEWDKILKQMEEIEAARGPDAKEEFQKFRAHIRNKFQKHRKGGRKA